MNLDGKLGWVCYICKLRCDIIVMLNFKAMIVFCIRKTILSGVRINYLNYSISSTLLCPYTM